MSNRVSIAVAYGNGIGPETMEAGTQIITSAGSSIQTEDTQNIETVHLRGNSADLTPSAQGQ